MADKNRKKKTPYDKNQELGEQKAAGDRRQTKPDKKGKINAGDKKIRKGVQADSTKSVRPGAGSASHKLTDQAGGRKSAVYGGKKDVSAPEHRKAVKGTHSTFVFKDPDAAMKHKNKETSICPVAKKCGGCKWIHKPYDEQLRQKEKWLSEMLAPFCKAERIIGMDNPAHYRNKVHAVFGEDRKHNPISGIYEEGTHNIVPVDTCMIEDVRADAIIVSIRGLLKSFKIRPYNEDTGYGLLRHVIIRTGYVSGEIMVVLVLSSPVLPSRNNFVKALLKLHPEITTIVVNVNNRSTSMVLGDKEQAIYGKGYIEDELCGKVFRISPKSFYQVNPVQTEKLYARAMDYAGLTGKEVVVDAYCGTGTIGMIASSLAAQVIGVELNADAVRDARSNAKRNGVDNIQFYQNDAGKFLVGMAEQNARVDVVFMDPPRSGSDEAFLTSLAALAPEKIVYISCNPETLVRDLRVMVKKGYRVVRGGGVDMFPFTNHVETVALLVRKP